jgi:hypothetical protein
MESNLPATQDDAATVPAERDAPAERRPQPIAVALLPLALATFLVLAFVMAAWTFLHAAY